MWKKWIKYCLLLALVVFSPKALSVGDYSEFSYNGNVQTYNVVYDGWYQLEVWGSAGAYRNAGYGGYSVGFAKLKAGDVLYIVCGGQPYNGGGNGWGANFDMSQWGWDSYDWDGVGPGGGATHIALNSNRGVLSNYKDYQSEILIVAGGGGGADDENDGSKAGGAGGGLSGVSKGGAGGTQTSGYAFGQGATASGGGWYGGQYNFDNGSGGGSGYIGGVTSWNGTNPSTTAGQNSTTGKAKITFKEFGVLKDASYSTSNVTYNGSSQSGITGSNIIIKGTSSAVNAGTYSATLIPASGHAWSFDGTTNPITVYWTINKKSVTIPSLSNKSKTYNGSAQSPTVNNRDTNTVSQSGTTSATNAGTYTITWNLIDSDNYIWKDDTGTAKSESWTIARAKTATASKADKIYNQSEQTGVSGSYVTWTGTTKATNPGTYKATATPDSNHAWSDGTTSSKDFTWYIFQNWKRYTVRCVTDSLNKPVLPTDTIEGSYTIQEIIFDIKAQDTSSYTFCVGYTPVKTDVNYNGYKAGVYYWENGGWVKK